MKKGSLRTSFVFLLVAFLVLFAAASLVANIESEGKVTGSTIRIKNSNTIQVPDSHQPLPNEDEGTIVLWTKPPIEIFDQFSDTRDYIIFYSSTNVPGLRIVYNMKSRRFEAGTPLMESPEIDIFDSQDHQVVYTFKKDMEQALYLDGAKVASSMFKPMKISQVTGFAVALASIKEVEIGGIEVAVYDRYIEDSSIV
ncbi:MAG: hypothetical protein KKD17_02830 [Nanoarchaeota archaeon]|nr:hypothetical protein [Nanoarchaeota archaeon]